MSQTIFLSAVSNEFGVLRNRIARLFQRTGKLHVRHQGDMGTRGVRTLHKLQEEIQESNVVFHILGAQPGDPAPVEQVKDLLNRLTNFQTRFPEVAALGLQEKVSYTQWEAWLALYFKKRLCGFKVMDRMTNVEGGELLTPPHVSQQEHIQRLDAIKYYPDPVANIEALYDGIIHELITLGLLTKQEAHRPILLPYPSLGTLFKGREEFLQQLRVSLKQTTEGRTTALLGKALHGLGGVGKTRLAVEYAWQYRDDYSAVLFVTADAPNNLQKNLAELVGPLILNLPEKEETEEELKMRAALNWLCEHPGWLLILDNVDTEEALHYVEDRMAQLQGGQVLITSRLAKNMGEHIQPLELDVLPQEAAVDLLLERTTPKGSRGRKTHPDDEKHAIELAKELDGLALALEQAIAFIISQRLSLADYFKRWKKHEAKVQTWHRKSDMKYPRSVASTWYTTLEQLGPGEVALMNILAWFAPDSIPLFALGLSCESVGFNPENHEEDADKAAKIEEIWFEGVAVLEESIDSQSVGIIKESKAFEGDFPSSLRDSLGALADFSMVRWNIEADSITMHRVVQEILRTRQPEPAQWLSMALRLLDQARPTGDSADVRTWPRWEPIRPHVTFATQEADRLNIFEPTATLMGGLGTMLWGKALHREAEELERRALAIDEQYFGKNSPRVAVRASDLAQTLKATNRLEEAEQLMRRVLEIDEVEYGETNSDVARDLNNLAQLLQATNRMEEAEQLMRRALSIDEAAYEADHPTVAIRLNNLARLLQATNRMKEAEPMMRRALVIDEKEYGAAHPKVAIRLSNLASLLQGTNRLEEAEPLMRRALAIDEEAYKGDHPTVALRVNNLAQLLQATNRLEEAEPLMRLALTIDEAASGVDHPDVAHDLNNLAQLLKATNRLEEAEPLMRQMSAVYYLFQQRTGHEHRNMRSDVENYRGLLRLMNCSPDEMEQRVTMAMHNPGPLQAITHEVEQLLGATKPVQEILNALDQQYREQGKPPIWFLPLTEPLAPHLDDLLGSVEEGK